MQGEVQLFGFNKSGGKCACQGTELWAPPGAPGALSLVFATELWLPFSREAAAVGMDGVFGSTCSYCGIQTVSLGWLGSSHALPTCTQTMMAKQKMGSAAVGNFLVHTRKMESCQEN